MLGGIPVGSVLATRCFEVLSGAALRSASSGEESVYCSVDNLTFQIRSTIPSLVAPLVPALDHLRIAESDNPDLVIRVHRGDRSELDFPLAGTSPGDRAVDHNRDETNPVAYFSDEYTQGIFKYKTGALSFFNGARRLAVHWLDNGNDIPVFERDRPLREILKWWLGTHGFMVLHAACVSHAGVGVLLVGGSGAGKSSIALSCLQSGFQYLGDEYVPVHCKAAPTAYCFYSSGRLATKDVSWYPGFASLLRDAPVVDPGKALLFLNLRLPEQITPSCRIGAIVAPRITGEAASQIRKASPAKIVTACAPSTIFQQPGSGRRDFSAIADLAGRVPCYILEAGTRRDEIPGILRKLLKELG